MDSLPDRLHRGTRAASGNDNGRRTPITRPEGVCGPAEREQDLRRDTSREALREPVGFRLRTGPGSGLAQRPADAAS